jgi:hypothetical protein
MSSFEDRLKQAAARGANKQNQNLTDAERKKAEAEELKSLHSKYRLVLSERIEIVVKKVVDLFPGFRYQTVFGDAGWGGACMRDDLVLQRGARENRYSRFEMAVRPVNEYFVLDLQAKGTIANRELLTRNFYQPLAEVDLEKFKELVEQWALVFAELYTANR